MNAAMMPFTDRVKQSFNWRKITLALALLAMTGWIVNEARIRFPIRSHGMSEYTKHLKTVCVGRYLWDVPQSAQLGTISQTINGISIARMPDQALSDDLLEMSLAQYERNLRKELEKLEYSGIKEVRPFSKNGKLFLFQHESPTGGVLNAHAYVGVGRAIYKLSYEFATEYTNKSLEDMAKVASILRPRAADEIPTEPGLCIDGGFAAGKGFENEETLISYELKDTPGFGMSLKSSYAPNIGNGMHESTIDRLERQRHVAMFVPSFEHMSTQRKATVQLAGGVGQELIFTNELEGIKSLAGIAEATGDGSYQHQLIEVQMFNATKNRTSAPNEKLNDDAAITIWDAVIKGIRLRPGAA